MSLPPGSLLTGEALRKAIENGCLIDPTTVGQDSLREAGYYLRLSRDYIQIPASRQREEPLISNGEPTDLDYIHLHPGETAVVASEERIQLDWEHVGVLGPKFSLAAKGLLTQTGLVIDSGYGREPDETGQWVPTRPGARLSFVLTNLGAKTITLRPGEEKIVRLVAFSCESPEELPPAGFTSPPRFGADRPSGLAQVETLATDIEQLQRQVAGAERGRTEDTRGLGARLETLELRMAELLHSTEAMVDSHRRNVDSRLAGMGSGLEYVIVFGVFLIAAAILGVMINVGATALRDFPQDSPWYIEALAFVSLVGYVVLMTAIGHSGLRRLKQVGDPSATEPGDE